MTLILKRDTTTYRVLVELAGQDRPMTVHELFDATGLAPEVLHRIVTDLAYGDGTPYVERDWQSSNINNPSWKLTWEGQEALRRVDAVRVTASMAPVKRRRLRLRKTIPTYQALVICAMWSALALALGYLLGSLR